MFEPHLPLLDVLPIVREAVNSGYGIIHHLTADMTAITRGI
jgi:hypothetical protein